MPSLTVTLSLPPKALSPNARTHWAAKAKAVAAYRGEAFLMARRAVAGVGKGGDWWAKVDTEIMVRSTFWFRVERRRDRDNAQASLKAALDGIAEALGVDDSRFVMAPATLLVDPDNPRVEVVLHPAPTPAQPIETP
jgi:crossover junction endodeoxyribonuclease RusA